VAHFGSDDHVMGDPAALRAGDAANSASSRFLERFGGFVHFVGLFWFVVFEIMQLVQHGTDGFHEATLQNAVICLIGINGIVAACGHLFFPVPTAAAIGWSAGGPFQWEVGMANLGIGVAGVIAGLFGHEYWLAVILVALIFLGGAAVGHLKEVILRKMWPVATQGPSSTQMCCFRSSL